MDYVEMMGYGRVFLIDISSKKMFSDVYVLIVDFYVIYKFEFCNYCNNYSFILCVEVWVFWDSNGLFHCCNDLSNYLFYLPTITPYITFLFWVHASHPVNHINKWTTIARGYPGVDIGITRQIVPWKDHH